MLDLLAGSHGKLDRVTLQGFFADHDGKGNKLTTLCNEEKALAAIKAGTLHPFRCPVVRQDGQTVECGGNGVLPDQQILGMNFYIRGIEERVPSAN